jgi:hypothetical protein
MSYTNGAPLNAIAVALVAESGDEHLALALVRVMAAEPALAGLTPEVRRDEPAVWRRAVKAAETVYAAWAASHAVDDVGGRSREAAEHVAACAIDWIARYEAVRRASEWAFYSGRRLRMAPSRVAWLSVVSAEIMRKAIDADEQAYAAR